MPALDTVGQYITESRRLLQDQNVPYRYPDIDLVDALNLGLMEARRLRADLFIPQNFVVPYLDTSGTIDTTALVPMDVMYRSALVYYMIGHAQLRDDESTTDSRASAFMQKFLTQMLVITS
jgi:hypothetical protein